MRRCVRQSKRSVRKRGEQLRCTCPEDPPTQSDELTKSITCRTDPGANIVSEEEEKKVLSSVQEEWRQGCQSHVPHDGRQQLRVNGCDGNPAEGTRQVCGTLLVEGLESFGVTGEMVLQTGKETGPRQNTLQLKEKRQPSSDRPLRKAANQTRTLSEHTEVSKPWSKP